MPPCYHLGMSKLQEMLAEYRRLTLDEYPWPLAISEQAQAIADYLLTLDASDLDKRDSAEPKAPPPAFPFHLED